MQATTMLINPKHKATANPKKSHSIHAFPLTSTLSSLQFTMPRRTNQVLESVQLMNTAQIFRESLRLLLLHPTHFQSISIFLFSPLPLSLFVSHFLIHQFPGIPSSTLGLTNQLFGQNGAQPLVKLVSKTIFHIIICFPSSITFSLLGRAATVQAVADSYNGININGRRLCMRSGFVWVKLLHTCLWEFSILLCLFGVLVLSLAIIPKILFACGMCSMVSGFWGLLLLLGVPYCVGFAHTMVLGNLARVLAVLENDCYGVESLIKAKSLIERRRQTALMIALLSNVGLRLVECLYEFRMGKGLSLWEGLMLVSMYSFLLVLDTVMNVVFYYTCKP